VDALNEAVKKARHYHYANARLVVMIFYECNGKCPHCCKPEMASAVCVNPEQKGEIAIPMAFNTCPLPKATTAAINVMQTYLPAGQDIPDDDEVTP